MKKRNLLLKDVWLVSMLLCGLLTLNACAKDDKSEKNQADATEMPKTPTEDQLTVKSNLKTFVVAGEYSDVGKALINRMISKSNTLDASTQVIIINDNNITSLTNEQFSELIHAMVSGANLVYCKPTRKNCAGLILALGLIINQMYEDGEFVGDYNGRIDNMLSTLGNLADGGDGEFPPFFEDIDDTNGVVCEAIVFNDSSYYIAQDIDDKGKSKTVITTIDDKGNETHQDVSNPDTTPEATPYECGIYADIMVNWLTEQSDLLAKQQMLNKNKNLLLSQLRSTRGGDQVHALEEVGKCQVVTYTFWANSPTIPSQSSTPVTVTYNIWAVHSPAEKSDYYLIRQETRIENSRTKCGPTEATLWYPYPEHKSRYSFDGGHTYGSYMSGFSILSSFNSNGVVLVQASPNNDTTAGTSYTEGFNWNIGGGLTIGSTPSLNLSGSFGFSKSWTTNIPDLGLTFSFQGNTPLWRYRAGTLPDSYISWFNIGHTAAKHIMMNDCSVAQSWIWKQQVRSSNEVFSFESTIECNKQMLGFQDKVFRTQPLYITETTKRQYCIYLNAPPRELQQWQMDCAPYTSDLQTFMAVNYSDYWKPTFGLAVTDPNDRTAINERINAFIAVLKNSQYKWQGAGYAGKTFTFRWKQALESKPYREFTFTVNN